MQVLHGYSKTEEHRQDITNEFTPLLPSAEDNPPEEQSNEPQPSTAHDSDTGLPGALALLPKSQEQNAYTSSGSHSEYRSESHAEYHSESRTQETRTETRTELQSQTHNLSESRTGGVVSYGTLGGVQRDSIDEAISSAIADGFEGADLVRHRSRLGSYPVQDLPENIKKRDSIHITAIENARDSSPDDDGETPGGSASSKYMVVGTVRFWFVFLTVLLGYFVACFDITLMASSHPVITSYFNASNEASWLTTAFMITNTGFQPLWGRLSDTIGRKSVYLLVLSIFALTNLWCGLANDIGSFIAARTVCGVGAGGTMSMGLVVVNDLVKVECRGTYISHINVAFGIGAACGAAFGGVICDSIGWRWAFGIQVPVIALCMVCVFFTVPNGLGPMLMTKSTNKQGDNPGWAAVKNFDHLGLWLLVSAVTFFILFFNMGGNEFAWSHPAIISFIVIAVVLGAAALYAETRAKQPVMPLHLLVTRPYANLTYANFLAGIASNTVLFNAPLWFQAVELNTPSASGLRLASPAIAGSIAGVLTGYIITYTRRLKPMLIIGSIVYLAGSIAIYFMSRHFSEAIKIILITPTPMSQGFIYPGSMMAAFATSPQEEQGVVTTTLSLWRNLGIVVGVSISSLVFQNMLNVYLEKLVVGEAREWYIELAKSSVRAVVDMPEPYQGQVRDAYAMALKLSFITAIAASALLLILMIPMKLPKLRRGEAMNVAGGE